MSESTTPANAKSATLSSTLSQGRVSSGIPEDPQNIIKTTADTLSGPSTTDLPVQHDHTVPPLEPSVSATVPASSTLKQATGYSDTYASHTPAAKDTDTTYSPDTGEITESGPTRTKKMQSDVSMSTTQQTLANSNSSQVDGNPASTDSSTPAPTATTQQTLANSNLSQVNGNSASTDSSTPTPTTTTQQTLANSNSSQVDGNSASTDSSTPAPTTTTQQTSANSNSNKDDGNPASTDSSTPAPTTTTQQTSANSNSSLVDGNPASTDSSTPAPTTTTQQTSANSNSNKDDGNPASTDSSTPAPTTTTQQTSANSNSSLVDGNPASTDSSTPAPTTTTQQTSANSNSSQVDGNPASTDSSTPAPTTTTQQTSANSNSNKDDGNPASTGISTADTPDHTTTNTTPSLASNTSTLFKETQVNKTQANSTQANNTQANNSNLIEEDIGKAITDSIEEWKKRKANRSEFREVDYDPVSICIGVIAIILTTAFFGLLIFLDGQDIYKQSRRAKRDIDSRFRNVQIKQRRRKIHPTT